MVNMAAPATEHVRNIVLVGQDGAGKTSLAEAMLHVSGRTPRMGTTHDGKSYLDYDDEEIRRKFTIGTSIAPVPYKDYKINLLDEVGSTGKNSLNQSTDDIVAVALQYNF